MRRSVHSLLLIAAVFLCSATRSVAQSLPLGVQPDGPQQFRWVKVVTTDSTGNVYFAGGPGAVSKITTDGQVLPFVLRPPNNGEKDPSRLLRNITGLLFDGDNLFIANGCQISLAGTDGIPKLIVGDTKCDRVDGVGTNARLQRVKSITLDAAHNLYVSDHNPAGGMHMIRKIAPNGMVTTLKQADGSPLQRNEILGIAADASGNILYANLSWGCIEKVTPTGEVSVVVGRA